jgi:hypothetical protein
MKRKLLAVGLLFGTAFGSVAVGSPTAEQVVYAQPKPATPTPKPAGAPAPRAGGFPMELALPLLGGGAAALGGGVLLLRRGKKQE